MGLDMYLSAELYLSSFDEKGTEKIRQINDILGIPTIMSTHDPSRVEHNSLRATAVKVELGYWRKANQIHNWFVKNVQDGRDECQLSYVDEEKVDELYDVCKEVWDSKSIEKAKELLPPSEGFFFGHYEIESFEEGSQENYWGYWKDIKTTMDYIEAFRELTKSNKNFKWAEVYYRSSW